ncbi:DUF6350 family protein [Bowdeniella nasicola]|uniref:cell division protein PerM n=1 Tax=Bowdeniella nasicola TaxID=208480 RepID=UPI001161063F|nr:DUF6350 family protein [Bowdeniella nasicola]
MSTFTTTSPRFLPVGWLRATLAGVEAVVLTWLAVASVALIAYTSTATAPQLGNATWTAALKIATGAFFLAFGQPIETSIGPISLAPSLLTLLVGLLSYAACRRLDGTGLRQLWCTGAGASAAAVMIGAIAGTGLRSLAAAVVAGIVAALGNLAAMGPEERALDSNEWNGHYRTVRRLLERLPGWMRRAVSEAIRGIWWLSLLGLAAFVAAVIAAWHRVSYATTGLSESVADTIAIWLAQLGYLPTAVTWAFGWLTGAGYSVGPVRFAPGQDATGLLPAVPILGAGPRSAWSMAMLLVPAIAVLALALWHNHRRGEETLSAASLKAVTVAVLLVAAAVLAAVVTSGAVGRGLLARNGVWPLHMLAFSLLAIALPYVLGTVLSHPATRTWIKGKAAKPATQPTAPAPQADEEEVAAMPDFLREDGDQLPKS